MLISFEGGEGSGKSTVIGVVAERLREQGHQVLTLREPGGTKLGEAVRSLLLDEDLDHVPRAELLLFLAARAQLVETRLRPALRDPNTIVLLDRFVDSTVVYQGTRGIEPHEIIALNQWVLGEDIQIDLTLYLHVDPEIGLARKTEHNRIDREDLSFHREIAQRYLDLAHNTPRIKVIDAMQPLQDVIQRCWAEVIEVIRLTTRTHAVTVPPR